MCPNSVFQWVFFSPCCNWWYFSPLSSGIFLFCSGLLRIDPSCLLEIHAQHGGKHRLLGNTTSISSDGDIFVAMISPIKGTSGGNKAIHVEVYQMHALSHLSFARTGPPSSAASPIRLSEGRSHGNPHAGQTLCPEGKRKCNSHFN